MTNGLFYAASAVALVATVMVITARHAVHALLYFIVSLFAVALVFFLLGAPFVAVLELIVYAGAIMVLFVFVVMLLALGPEAAERERTWLRPGMWLGPSLLAAVLLVQLVALFAARSHPLDGELVGAREVGLVLVGPYVLGVELASMLLLAGLVGAFHLGRRATAGEVDET